MLSATIYFALVYALLSLIIPQQRGKLFSLFQDLKLEVRSLLHDLPIESRDGDRALEHLTEEQWQQHSVAYSEFLYGVGKYRNFNRGFSDWLASEGLPPSPYLERLEEQSKT
jgi:hypothetical protein